jgi:hypothetical protein
MTTNSVGLFNRLIVANEGLIEKKVTLFLFLNFS